MAFVKHKNQNRVARGKVRYTFDLRFDGKRYRKNIICQKSAVQSLYRNWEIEIVDGDIRFGDYQLFEMLDTYLAYVKDHKSETMVESETWSISIFKKFFKDMKLKDFRKYHISDFIAWRKQNPMSDAVSTVTSATINRHIACLSSFFNFCIEREYYTRINPAFKTKLKENNDREIRLTTEQMVELLDKAKEEGLIYTAVLIALLAGLRRNEVITLKWSDIDFNTSMIHLSGNNTKGKKRRVVCMPEFLKVHLMELRKDYPFTKRVFENWTTFYKLRYDWEELRDKLSFKLLPNGLTLHFHDLRHVYAQSLRDAGVPLDDIQTLLGHHSVRVTESRYAQFGGKDAKEKVDKIQNIIPLTRCS